MHARVRRHLETIVVAGIVGALAAGGPAVAGTLVQFAKRAGNSDKVDGIDASRTPRAGVLLALNANAKFPRSVVPASARGAKGARGPVGPAGLLGAIGPAGAKGETGAAGSRGATGEQGLQGLQGLHGTDGATGPQGPVGATGEAGPAGAAGPQGATGSPGAAGEKGDTGDAGAAGTDGATGPQGPAGATGEAGPAGAAGPQGATGSPGAPGEKGDTGDAGADGAPGAAGPKGDKGETGDVGPAGSAAAYAPIVDINPILRPSGSQLWDGVFLNGSSWFNGYRSSFPTGTSESYVEWDVPLQAGTWTIDVVYVKSSDAGIMTLSVGGTDLEPAIDAFRAPEDGIAYNQVATFSGVSVASTGIHTVKIRTASKNSLSTGHFGYLTWIRLVRE